MIQWRLLCILLLIRILLFRLLLLREAARANDRPYWVGFSGLTEQTFKIIINCDDVIANDYDFYIVRKMLFLLRSLRAFEITSIFIFISRKNPFLSFLVVNTWCRLYCAALV